MINKLVLQSLIKKYHLGEVEQVKWIVENKTLSIDFTSVNKEVIGNITHKGFDLEDCELPIFDTKKLLNLLSITQGDLLVELEERNKIYTKVKLADENYNLTYALADPLLIPKSGKVTEPEWDVKIDLEKEHLLHLTKAKSALTGIDNLTISIGKDPNNDLICLFTFGDEEGHNNKINYQLYGKIKEDDVSLPFNSDIFKSILDTNKEMETGKMFLSYKGLMKFEFQENDTTSTYFMIRRENSAF